jgi:hypothetical protein
MLILLLSIVVRSVLVATVADADGPRKKEATTKTDDNDDAIAATIDDDDAANDLVTLFLYLHRTIFIVDRLLVMLLYDAAEVISQRCRRHQSYHICIGYQVWLSSVTYHYISSYT